jgi:hypothetical protein
LPDVKHLRIIMLALLAILLPVRGVVAATMLCPAHADHPSAHHHASEEAPDTDPSSAENPATCHFCASACCMASIVCTLPSLSEPGLTASDGFPALTAPVPVFQSDGQDRPPRTI